MSSISDYDCPIAVESGQVDDGRERVVPFVPYGIRDLVLPFLQESSSRSRNNNSTHFGNTVRQNRLRPLPATLSIPQKGLFRRGGDAKNSANSGLVVHKHPGIFAAPVPRDVDHVESNSPWFQIRRNFL